MFCFQCQETAKNTGCTIKGVCGKQEETSHLQDLLIFVLKGISVYGVKLEELGAPDRSNGEFIASGLFATITNVCWDNERYISLIKKGLERREGLRTKFLNAYKERNGKEFEGPLPDAATWYSDDASTFDKKAATVGILATENEDVRSLRELSLIHISEPTRLGMISYAVF